MTPAQKHLHGWLCLNSGDSLDQLWEDIEKLRKASPPMYEHLPNSRVELETGLLALESQGLAAMQNDGGWKYKQEKPKPAAAMLF
jgi:hypothetical protein